MLLEQLAPRAVAELRDALGRAHDVGEEHGRQQTIRLGPAAHAGEELLDLVEQCVGVAGPDEVVVARKLDVSRSRDLLRDPACLFDLDVEILRPM
jgi:hypothetical protein